MIRTKILFSAIFSLIFCNHLTFTSETCWSKLQKICCCSWLSKSQRRQAREEWIQSLRSPTSMPSAASEHEMYSTPTILKQHFTPSSPTLPDVRAHAQAPSPEHSPTSSSNSLNNRKTQRTFSPPSLVALDTQIPPFKNSESPVQSPTTAFHRVESEDYQLPDAQRKTTKSAGSWWPFSKK